MKVETFHETSRNVPARNVLQQLYRNMGAGPGIGEGVVMVFEVVAAGGRNGALSDVI